MARLVSVLVTLLCICSAYAQTATKQAFDSLLYYFNETPDKDYAYFNYAIVFNKLINGNVDPYRQKVFYDNIARAVAQLERNNRTVLGISAQSDWTLEEIAAYSFGKSSDRTTSLTSQTTPILFQPTTTIPPVVNKSDGGGVSLTPKQLASLPVTQWSLSENNLPRAQGSCASCWVWSSTGLGEWDAYLATGGARFRPLSVSQVGLCVPATLASKKSPCQGGVEYRAIDYMIGKDIAPAGYINEDAVSRIAEKVKRAAEIVDPTAPNAGTLTHTDTLPDLKRLLDQAGGCPAPNTSSLLVDSVTTIAMTESDIVQALQQGPVLIGMDASGLSDIDSDLVQWPSCGNNINHAVMVVGAGTGRDTYGVMTPYWLIRNSWGSDWGFKGHIKIPRAITEAYPYGVCAIYKDGAAADGPSAASADDQESFIAYKGLASANRRRLATGTTCSNALPDVTCEVWAAMGFCALSYSWAGQNVAGVWCAKTCLQCGNTTCIDKDPEDCPLLAQDGYCADPFVTDTGASVRNDICLNSCGTCAAQAASTTYNLSTCADIKAPGVDCPAWASQGLCAPENLWNAVSVANVWCRATCKTCASTKSCLDKSTRCPALAAGGYCQTDFLYAVNSHATAVNVVEELCPNTCGNPRCTEGAAALAKPKYCYDRHPSCADDLIDAEDVEGSCGGSYFDLPVDTYWCPVTCGVCAETEEPTTCQDRNPALCFDWASSGYCNTAFDGQPVASYWCAESCGTCNATASGLDVCFSGRVVVQGGDTLRSIALEQGVHVYDLMVANNLTDSFEDVYEGKALTIPCSGTLTPVNLDGAAPGDCPLYKVKETEDFVALAAKWGYSYSDLLLANPDVREDGDILMVTM